MFQHSANEANFVSSGKCVDTRFALPGFGRPLDFAPVEKNIYGVSSRSMFPSSLDDRDIENGFTEYVQIYSLKVTTNEHCPRLPVQTLREISMVAIMEELTDIPEWWIKVFLTKSRIEKSGLNQVIGSRGRDGRGVEEMGHGQL